MKTYNSPKTQITDCKVSYMLMQNVSGGGLKGVKQTDGPLGDNIEIY